MEPIFLSGKKARQLRAEGHHLNPAVMIGKDGLTPQVLHSIRKVLDTNPLIKVKILDTSDMNRKQFAAELAENTSSQVVQVLGKTILLYREQIESSNPHH